VLHTATIAANEPQRLVLWLICWGIKTRPKCMQTLTDFEPFFLRLQCASDVQPISVMLQLVRPTRPDRRLLGDDWLAGMDESGRRV
jgi:hypothetical protein